MRTLKTRGSFAAFLLLMWSGLALTPAGAVEDGLMGARIGSSYREVVRKFGHPVGMLMNAGGGMTYQSLPSFRGNLPVMGGGGGNAALPLWAEPVRVSFLGNQQAEWFYDLRRSRGVTLGIVLSGEGAEAVVTDVVISGYPEYLKGKRQYVRTERGVTFQSSFATVLQKYGFPPQLEVYTPGSAPAVATGRTAGGGGRLGSGAGPRANMGRAAGGGMRAGGNMRGRMGEGGGMGRRGRTMGEAQPRTTSLAAGGSSFTVTLTQGMRRGMENGLRRGGMRGGAGGGVRAGGRRPGGALPPLGAAASSPAAAMLSRLSASAPVNNQNISFSRDCVLTYNGIAFTLHDMRVIRIHVSE